MNRAVPSTPPSTEAPIKLRKAVQQGRDHVAAVLLHPFLHVSDEDGAWLEEPVVRSKPVTITLGPRDERRLRAVASDLLETAKARDLDFGRFCVLNPVLSAECARTDDRFRSFQRSVAFGARSVPVVVTNLSERDNVASQIAISHAYELPRMPS